MEQDFPRLLGDVGGTNARFALQHFHNGPIEQVHVLPCADYPTIEAAIRAYLQQVGTASVRTSVIGIANPITSDWIQMTNHHWSFSVSQLQNALGLQQLRFINDFTALALALPHIKPEHLRQVGGQAPVRGASMALLGSGTGMGVSALVFDGKNSEGIPLSGEGGHVTLAAHTPQQFRVIENIQRRFGHVSAERVLSGPGLVALYQALDESPQTDIQHSAIIIERALQGKDPRAVETLNLFCAFLGSTAGDLALIIGARGGVYIGGGIVPRFGTWIDTSPFRHYFEAKGRMKAFNAPIPCFVIQESHTQALLGASHFRG